MKQIMKFAGFAAGAAAFCVPSALAEDTVERPTFYGDLRYSVVSEDTGGEESLDAVNNASRIGFKGKYKNETLEAFYHLQAGVNFDNDGDLITNRFYYAGLRGSWGEVLYGRTSTPYKMGGVKLDPFYDTSVGTGNGGGNYGMSGMTNGFTNNSIAYSSPVFGGGFKANASVYLNDDDNEGDNEDFNVGGEYNNGGVRVGVQYAKTADDGAAIAIAPSDADAIRVYGRYAHGPFSVAASYETIDVAGENDARTYLYIPVTYDATEKLSFAAAYGTVDRDAGGSGFDRAGDGFSAGAFYKIMDKTKLSAFVSDTEFDDGGERQVIGVGIVQSISY